jgi:hypothetical protein
METVGSIDVPDDTAVAPELMPEPEPDFREVSDVGRWRGSPELLAHLARTVRRVVGDGSANSLTLTIDMKVGKDHEMFDEPADFPANATPEGLRHFKSICIRSEGDGRAAAITLQWRRPWWKPAMSPDGEVVMELSGDSSWIAQARETIGRALARGNGRIGSGGATAIGGFGLPAVLVATWVTIGYLLSIDADVVFYVEVLLGVLGFFGGAVGGTWAIPSLEVAAVGETNIRRIVKFVGPIVVAIALAGLTKKLFG